MSVCRLFVVVILGYFASFGSGKDVDTETVIGRQFYDPRHVREYNDYGSVTLFPFQIPDRVSNVGWQFIKHRSDSKCPKQSIYVALQSGSFPIVNPLNTSFPDFTYREHFYLQTYEIPADLEPGLSVMLSVDNPNPGYWFIVAWLEQDKNEQIKQEGLSRDCYYFLQVLMTYAQETSVLTLNDRASIPYTISEQELFAVFRYFAEINVQSIQVSITGCSSNNNSTWCPISLSFAAKRFPFDNDDAVLKCNTTEGNRCTFTITEPWQDTWYYLRIQKALMLPILLDFSIKVSVTICNQSPNKAKVHLIGDDNLTWYRRVNTSDEADHAYYFYKQHTPAISERFIGLHEEAVFPSPPDEDLYVISPDDGALADTETGCPKTILLSSFEGKSNPFKEFIRGDANDTELYSVPMDGQIIAKFYIDPVLDIGGTIEIKGSIDSKNVSSPDYDITVNYCLKQGSPPSISNGTECPGFGFSVSSDEEVTWNIPFPSGGWWYMSMEAECVYKSSEDKCPSSVLAKLHLAMIECIDLCGPYGGCHVYHQDGFRLYGCACIQGYSGWGCTDDTHAWSRAYFLAQVLLLTLSNIFFILPVILATYRHFFAEAVVYLCTMVFSTFYHACDSSKFCIMDYNTLQFCDFFASFMAIFATLICMAKLPSSIKQTLHMLGSFGLALATTYNRFSLWAAAVPITCGVVTVLSSWGYRWHKTKRLYPSKRRWLFFLLPGIALTTAGLMVFAFLETESNYLYVHSVWHTCMAFGVMLLLPTRTRKDVIHDSHMSELIDVNALNSELVENEVVEY